MRVQAPLTGLWFIHIFHCSLMGAGFQYVCGPGRIKSAEKRTISYFYVSLGPLGGPAGQHSRWVAAILGKDGGDIFDYGPMDIGTTKKRLIAWAFLGLEARDSQASQACQGPEPIGGL